ncbi:MAG: hypothetical protein L3J35_11395 [Bacteroidales bacterium]|nr:hypothetical protein [Bacteroidales bacterium]
MRNLIFIISGLLLISVTSCTTLSKTMREPNVNVELEKSDFILSAQVSAEANSTKIIGIDFQRLLNKAEGNIEKSILASSFIDFVQIPVIGNILSDKTSNYALYELMHNNPGYDVVFYPQYEKKIQKPVLGIGFLLKKTTVKVTARLGKLN